MKVPFRKTLQLLTCAFAFGATAPAVENTIFVKVGDLKCGGDDADHKDWFTAATFSFGATAPAETSAGGAAGRATPGDVTIRKSFDACTPKLLELLARGTHVAEVVLEWTSGEKPVVFMRITLDGTQVGSVRYDATQETVAFQWQRLTIQYIRTKAEGGGTTLFFWDRRVL
jgi:type VI secretion system Hcp family effector